MTVRETRRGAVTHPARWGMILDFVDLEDDRTLAEQFDEKYIGGFQQRPGASWRVDNVDYPDNATLISLNYDETFHEWGRLVVGDEIAILFDSAFVAHRKGNGEWTVARMD